MKDITSLNGIESEMASAMPQWNGVRLPPFEVLAMAKTDHLIDLLRDAQKHPACGRMTWRYRLQGLDQIDRQLHEKNAPDILIIEADVSPEALIQQLTELSLVLDERTRVILITTQKRIDPRVMRDVFKLGVSEFLFPPFDAQEVVAAIGEVEDGDCLRLRVAATDIEGYTWVGEDIVWIKAKGNQ